jgi:hypothetical protein
VSALQGVKIFCIIFIFVQNTMHEPCDVENVDYYVLLASLTKTIHLRWLPPDSQKEKILLLIECLKFGCMPTNVPPPVRDYPKQKA